VGDVSTDPAAKNYRVSYAESLAQSDAAKANPDAYRYMKPVTSADFDQNYEPVSPTYPPATGSAYTVRSGDTLKSVAQALWGDSSLWYLIAEANGLSSAQTLTAGQVLVIPNKLTNIHNNASTFRPYSPG
jgi:nucleoid-associated protein YgaU